MSRLGNIHRCKVPDLGSSKTTLSSRLSPRLDQILTMNTYALSFGPPASISTTSPANGFMGSSLNPYDGKLAARNPGLFAHDHFIAIISCLCLWPLLIVLNNNTYISVNFFAQSRDIALEYGSPYS
jgi:hypothetical protein